MLSGIEVRNPIDSNVLSLMFRRSALSTPYLVKSIDGLGPVKAEIATSSYGSQNGGLVKATRLGMRTIVIKLGYAPDYLGNQTIENLRRDLYSYFPPKGEVTLRVLNDAYQSVDIKGVVESNEPVIFTKDPEVQITILCVEPLFTALSPVIYNSFNNTVINPSEKNMGETGFLLELFVNRTISQVTVSNGLSTDLVYAGELISGDALKISTIRGKKYVDRFRNGVNVGVLDNLASGAMNMYLDARTSVFKVTASGANDIPLKLTLTSKYLGL